MNVLFVVHIQEHHLQITKNAFNEDSYVIIRMYSLWIVPQAPLFDHLHAKIKNLATTEGISDAPTFVPHVTLVGGFPSSSDNEAIERSALLASRMEPFQIELDRVSFNKRFHQCVFILCKPTDELMRYGGMARSAFGQDPDEYLPHLSLLYSDEASVDARHRIANQEQLALFGEEEHRLPMMSFVARSLHLYVTPPEDKRLHSWREIATFDLI